jgi:hypothetical protein
MATAAVLPPEARPRLVKGRSAKTKLKPVTIDEQAKQYLILRTRAALLDEELDRAKERLLFLVREFGAVPPKAEKSKRVSGELYQVTATYGSSTSVDTAAAERMILTLIKCGVPQEEAVKFFSALFTFQPKYALASNAVKVIAGKLPKRAPRNLRDLFNRAVKVTPKAPTLSVDEIEKAKQ